MRKGGATARLTVAQTSVCVPLISTQVECATANHRLKSALLT